MITRTIGNEVACILPVLKKIVDAISMQDINTLFHCFDDTNTFSQADLTELVTGILEETIIDPFDTPCTKHFSIDFEQLRFYPWQDGMGLDIEYQLTTQGEESDWTLMISARYLQEQIAIIFQDIHIQ